MRTIGALIFDDFEMLDLYGPLQMFAMYPEHFAIRTVAETSGPIMASGGPATFAQDSFGQTGYDILLVPGGRGTRTEVKNPSTLDWLRVAGVEAELVTSVCTGAALLARAGLLDGRKATTNKRAFDWVIEHGQYVDWRARDRWVEDGKVFTSAGVSAGIDMSLAVLTRLHGETAARQAALWAEYRYDPHANFDPFEEET